VKRKHNRTCKYCGGGPLPAGVRLVGRGAWLDAGPPVCWKYNCLVLWKRELEVKR
jgi:hypothetical protein